MDVFSSILVANLVFVFLPLGYFSRGATLGTSSKQGSAVIVFEVNSVEGFCVVIVYMCYESCNEEEAS